MRNGLIKANHLAKGNADNVGALVSGLTTMLTNLSEQSTGVKTQTMKDAFEDFLTETEEKINAYNSGENVGVNLGLKICISA